MGTCSQIVREEYRESDGKPVFGRDFGQLLDLSNSELFFDGETVEEVSTEHEAVLRRVDSVDPTTGEKISISIIVSIAITEPYLGINRVLPASRMIFPHFCTESPKKTSPCLPLSVHSSYSLKLSSVGGINQKTF